MLTEVKKHLKLLGRYFLFNLKCSLQYRVSFIVQIVGMVINNSSFLFFWWIIYRNVESINGYSYGDVMLLWGLASSSFGFCHIFLGNSRNISNIIINGSLDSYLLQPKDIIINSSASKMVVSAWGDLLYGYILILVSGRFSLLTLSLFTLFTITGGLIFFAVTLAINSLTLYLGNVESTKRIVEMFFLTFSTYPEGLFGRYLRILFYTLIPVGFMVYLPVGIMANFNLVATLLVLASAALFVAGAYVLFYNGLKRYESGNLMEGKL